MPIRWNDENEGIRQSGASGMRDRHLFSLAGLTLLSVFLLSAAWEFALEDLIASWLAGDRRAETLRDHWEDIITATCLAGIALIISVLVSRRIMTGRAFAEGAEEDLEEGEPDFEAMMESARDAIISINAKGQIVSWNPQAEIMFGYSGEEMFGKPLAQLMPEKYHQAHAEGLARVNAGGERHVLGRTVELSGLREDGEEFPLELSLSTWTAGRERGYTGIIRDITERKRAEEALQRAEEALRKLVETAPDAIVVIDVDGKIVSWNPGARDIFGYDEEEAIGGNVTMLMPERYKQDHEAGLKRLRESGTARLIGRTVELHGLRKDGSEFPLELSLGSWSAGERTFFSAIIREITKRERQQAGAG
jgi:PAS domain S-box-containing protein